MSEHYRYRISFCDRYGTSNQIEMNLPYLIMRDAQCDLCLFELDRYVGSEEMLEHMIRQILGVDEQISIINATPI